MTSDKKRIAEQRQRRAARRANRRPGMSGQAGGVRTVAAEPVAVLPTEAPKPGTLGAQLSPTQRIALARLARKTNTFKEDR